MNVKFAALSSLFVALIGCSEDPGTGDPPRDAGAADAGAPDASATDLTSIRLVPDVLELETSFGVPVMGSVQVVGVYADGSTTARSLPVRFEIDQQSVAVIHPTTGEVTSSGLVGGEANVTATVMNRGLTYTARGQVTVSIVSVVTGPGVPADVVQKFGAAPVTDPARSADLVYPLDGAVMPQNVYPARIQWTRGAAGDLFRVRLSKRTATVDAFIHHDGAAGLDWLVETTAWRGLAQTLPDEPMMIRVDRFESATNDVIEGNTIAIRFARAALAGSIYYWDIAAGRIVRINDGTADRDAFFPSPPLGCVGCHSVSTSGRYMAGRFGGGENIGGVLDLTRDLRTDPPPLEFPISETPPSTRWWFSTWSPDDTRMIVSMFEGDPATRTLALVDPFSGMSVMPIAGTLPSGGVTHPAWSPDGSVVAYVSEADAWGGANSASNISLLPVTGADSFGTPTIAMRGDQVAGIPVGNAASYPTWSPSSDLIAFAHGSSSRSETGASALYAMARDGSGLVRLDRANGGAQTNDTFQPRFSPFTQGGYHWLSYLSRRDYGNSVAGTRGTGRQQIWISAVKASPTPGEDPSEVGYWLPGQDTASLNISAYWAPRACRAEGESCEVASECCSDDCRQDETGALVCSPEISVECFEDGQACLDNAECCLGSCQGGVCGSL